MSANPLSFIFREYPVAVETGTFIGKTTFEYRVLIQDTIRLIHEGSFATTGRQTVADRCWSLSKNKVFTHSTHQ